MNNLTSNDFRTIVLNNTPLIDVRAPIEFVKGSFQNSVNLPILSDNERHLVGTCYKEKGNDAATKLGHRLVSGDIKEDRLNKWNTFIKENPDAMIYCFRGGSRSTIAQRWIYEATDHVITKLDGGYKAFRNYLIDSLTNESEKLTPIVLSGHTGSGKTILINKLSNAINLEEIANHRGSSFGEHISPQPTQINFENNLSYELIRHTERGYKHVVLEDESRNIGKNFIPLQFTDFTKKGKIVVLEASLEERIENTLNEYVISSQKEYILSYGIDLGIDTWYDYIFNSMLRVKAKLGGDRLNLVLNTLNEAFAYQKLTGSYDKHRIWIELFLKEYYDPMYNYGLNKKSDNIIFKGNSYEVLEFLKELK